MIPTNDSLPTRGLRPISIPPKPQSSPTTQSSTPNRPSIRQLTSYYEHEARKSITQPPNQSIPTQSSNQSTNQSIPTQSTNQSIPNQSIPTQSIPNQSIPKRSFEDLIATYNEKIKKLEAELITINNKIDSLKGYINDIIINKVNNMDPQFELLELSSLYNEEIIILGSIYTYNQIVKNIVKNETV